MSRNKILNDIIAKSADSNKQTAKQKKIVETAINLFAEKGYSNTSTAEIAKLAEVSEGTIFKHYGTKENLLLSVLVPFIKESFPTMAVELFNEILTERTITFEDFLRAFLKNRISFVSENREIFQVFVKEIIYKEDLKNEILPLFYESGVMHLNKVIGIFKERGELKDISSERIVKILLTVMGGFIVSNFVLLNKQYINDSEIEDIINLTINGISNK